MTIIGEDKPGLVESVALIVTEHGGNWLESRMSRLGGKFAGILRVEVHAAHEKVFIQAVSDFKTQGLSIHVHHDADDRSLSAVDTVQFEAIGQDRPGIVSQITGVLTSHGVNVEELHTERISAPMSAELLFKVTAKLQLPDDYTTDALRSGLEQIAEDLMVDVSFDGV